MVNDIAMGVLRPLDEVVDFYGNGGAAGIGIKLSNQTLDATACT